MPLSCRRVANCTNRPLPTSVRATFRRIYAKRNSSLWRSVNVRFSRSAILSWYAYRMFLLLLLFFLSIYSHLWYYTIQCTSQDFCVGILTLFFLVFTTHTILMCFFRHHYTVRWVYSTTSSNCSQARTEQPTFPLVRSSSKCCFESVARKSPPPHPLLRTPPSNHDSLEALSNKSKSGGSFFSHFSLYVIERLLSVYLTCFSHAEVFKYLPPRRHQNSETTPKSVDVTRSPA